MLIVALHIFPVCICFEFENNLETKKLIKEFKDLYDFTFTPSIWCTPFYVIF